MRPEAHVKQIPELAIEIGSAGVRTREDADDDITQGGQSRGEQAERDGLPRAGIAENDREATFAGEVLDTPAEAVQACGHMQRLDGHVGRKGIPFQPIELRFRWAGK